MPRRKHTRVETCSFDGGCEELAFWEFDRVADRRAHEKEVPYGTWKCLRHKHPEEVLTPGNPVIAWNSEPVRDGRTGPFFGNRGFLHGEGFKAWAKDFPVGTKIRVTAEVLLPPPAEVQE